MLNKIRNKRRICIITVFLGAFLFLFLVISYARYNPKIEKSLFSWKSDPIADGGQSLFPLMKEEKIRTLYQHFDKEPEQGAVVSFLQRAEEQGIEIYYLTGEPQWALETVGESHPEREVERVAQLRQWTSGGTALRGIIFDIEPYLLEDWEEEENRAAVMERFVKLMQAVYEQAKAENLKVILCIPYFYDSQGQAARLEELTASCCDGIAVMNYYRGAEIEHIGEEAKYAALYGKELINIYELQKPGKHGLTDKNTYYGETLDSVEENFRALSAAYPDLKIIMSLHEYRALKEVKARE